MVFAKAAAHTSQTNFNRTMKRGEEGVSVPRPPLSLCLMRARLPLRVYDCVCDRPVPSAVWTRLGLPTTHTTHSDPCFLLPPCLCVSPDFSLYSDSQKYTGQSAGSTSRVCVCACSHVSQDPRRNSTSVQVPRILGDDLTVH